MQEEKHNGDGQAESAPPGPETLQIVVDFAVGAADPNVHVDNRLSPIQLLAAAGILTWMAGKRLDQSVRLQQQRQPKIAVPKIALPGQHN